MQMVFNHDPIPTSDNNGVRVGTNNNKEFTIVGNYLKHTFTSRYVGVYTTNPDWRCYTTTSTNISGQTLAFYVLSVGGNEYSYTTSIADDECKHANTEEVEALAPTCASAGYTAGVFCNDCERFISGHETLDKVGHNYDANGYCDYKQR